MTLLCIFLSTSLIISLIFLWKKESKLISLDYTSIIKFDIEQYTFKCIINYTITGTLQSHKYIKNVAESIFKYDVYQLTKGIKMINFVNSKSILCEELKQVYTTRFNYDNPNEFIVIKDIKITN